ncbi:hypothetical protein NDU88_000709 [Pleurodeles waltl]|uniref:Uncharacterized protein n=1 Tax=Pleurodeles waltl TaxID=8319 RepID=A0AAV7U6B4_PLEWA|nr:hypothetical protein NDU88_000709 [Pleurodeles waltl]
MDRAHCYEPSHHSQVHPKDNGNSANRLYDYPAPDASESGIKFRSYRGDDASHRYLGNGDAGSRRGNPDIRVPERPEKDDGLHKRGTKGDRNAERDEEERNEETEDAKRNGDSEAILEFNDQPCAGKRAERRKLRHVPQGTWLTQVRSFLKDKFYYKGESDGRRGEGRDSAGRGEEKIGRRPEEERH